MPDILDPIDFTTEVSDKLGVYDIDVSSTKPLSIMVVYGENEPTLTLDLQNIYEEYKKSPEQLPVLVQPLVTEVGWTVHGTRYAFTDISEHSLPLMRDLKRNPFTEEETAGETTNPKGPLLYQELVNRPEEHIIVQFVMTKNDLTKPLYTGDMLRSYPEPAQFTAHAVQNLRNVVLRIGLTLSEYKVENFGTAPWLVGLRGGAHRQFLASLITVPEVMRTLQETLNAEDGLVAVLPARDHLLVTAVQDESTIVEMGLLARYLKDESSEPVSGFIWHFKDGLLSRVQTIDMSDQSEPENN